MSIPRAGLVRTPADVAKVLAALEAEVTSLRQEVADVAMLRSELEESRKEIAGLREQVGTLQHRAGAGLPPEAAQLLLAGPAALTRLYESIKEKGHLETSSRSALRNILASFPQHHRKCHATQEELTLAADFALLTYMIRPAERRRGA